MKILTILVPTYNVEKYLSRCLNTLVFNKDILNDIEILIVNDGSKDESLKIAKEYEKNFECITVIDKENGGHGSTINVGLNIAKGKYFRVIDSDDWVNIDEFANYVNDLKKLNTDIVLTNYSRESIFNSEKILFKYKNLEYNKIIDLNKFDYSVLGYDYFYMATTTFKTEKLRNSNLKLDEKTFYVDMEFILLPFLEMKTLYYLNYDIYRYYIGRAEQSISIQNYVKNRYDHEKVLTRLLNFYNSIIDDKRKEYISNVLCLVINSHYSIYLKAKLPKQENIKEIRKFDSMLKENYNDLYTKIRNDYLYIKWGQNTNFRVAQFYNNIISRIADAIQNRRRKKNEKKKRSSF